MVKCTSERIAEELAEEIRSGTLRAAPSPRNTTRSNCPDSHFPFASSS